MTRLFDRFRHRPDKSGQPAESDALSSLRIEVANARRAVSELQTRVTDERQRAGKELADLVQQAGERARLAGMPFARLGSDSLVLEGPSRRRLQVARISIGEAVEHSVASRLGVIESATADSRIQALWESLHRSDSSPDDEGLRGAPSTVLDIPGAVVRSEEDPGRAHGRTLRVSVHPTGGPAEAAHGVVAVPKFTFDFAQRKLRNFGHWLLDCVPQVVALSAIAPTARVLLPAPLRGFQRATLELIGLPAAQAVAWDGSPVEAARLLVFESDGRAGGRPLSALLETRRVLASRGTTASMKGRRRIYVSRRDADPKRRWVSNEPEVEALFASRGFEVVVMADCSLDDQIGIFREAGIVAGVSGAGLADIVFSAPGTHVVVLLSDSLMSWYADQRGSRSGWIRTGGSPNRRLSMLGDSPHFYVHLAAAFEQQCHCFLGGDQMPIERLSAFLDEVEAQVDGA